MENWDDLRVFLHVARSGGLTAARDALKMDVATVGRRIARLEASQGTVLFQRSPQGYALTTAGQTLLTHVEQAETQLQTGLGTLSQDADQLTGTVRIGAPDGCANYVLPQICTKLVQDHPDLDIQIVALPRVISMSRREADMVIGVSPPKAGRLVVQKICDYKLWVAASGQSAQNVIGYIPDMIFDSELDYLGDLGLPKVRLSSNSIAVQMNLLRQGAGMGVVHAFAMPSAPELRRTKEEFELTRSYYLIRAKEDQKDLRLSRIAELLTAAVKSEVVTLERAALGKPKQSA